ncbi:unnamed protein product [Coccothraustes coccothraustes]
MQAHTNLEPQAVQFHSNAPSIRPHPSCTLGRVSCEAIRTTITFTKGDDLIVSGGLPHQEASPESQISISTKKLQQQQLDESNILSAPGSFCGWASCSALSQKDRI